MSSFKEIFARLAQLFVLVWTCLIDAVLTLAHSLEPRAPPPELPVSSKSLPAPSAVLVQPSSFHEIPHQGQDMAGHHVRHGPPRGSKLSQGSLDAMNPRPAINKKRSGMGKSHILCPTVPSSCIQDQENYQIQATDTHPHDLSLTSLSHALSDGGASSSSFTTDENFTNVHSPTLSSADNYSIYSTPFSSPPATPVQSFSPTDALFVSQDINTHRVHVEQWIQSLGSAQGIGDLGQRRGFKGAPLFTSATAKNSPFLTVPSTFSPRTPRSPLAPMTNFIKISTPKTSKRSPTDEKQVAPSLQEDFDLNDPFGTNSDSFYAPKVGYMMIPSANLENFMSYQRQPPARMPSLKRKPAMADLHSPPPTEPTFKKPSFTNTYDISIYQDIDTPTKSKSQSKVKSPSEKARRCEFVEIKLTPPSAPSSPKRGNLFPIEQVPVPTIAAIHDMSTVAVDGSPLEEIPTPSVDRQDTMSTVAPDACDSEDLVLGKVDDISLDDRVRMLTVGHSRRDVRYTIKVLQCKQDFSENLDDHFILQEIKARRRTGGIFSGVRDASAALDANFTVSRRLTQVSLDHALTTQAALDKSNHAPSTLYSRLQGYFTGNLEHNEFGSGTVPPLPVLHDPKRISGLRPLVLPLQVAKRNAALAAVSAPGHSRTLPWPPLTSGPDPLTSSSFPPSVVSSAGLFPASNAIDTRTSISVRKTLRNDSPILGPSSNHRSKALGDIITLLAAADFTLCPKGDSNGTYEDQAFCQGEDNHWSDGLLETYAL